LSQFKKYHPSGNLKFYNIGILRSLKLRILVKKIPLISLKLNFTPNTLGCKRLKWRYSTFDINSAIQFELDSFLFQAVKKLKE